jgi:hypothetical protein
MKQIQLTLDGTERKPWITQEWCERCKEITDQTEPANHGENYDTTCCTCGHKNFHIQGFNYNLM